MDIENIKCIIQLIKENELSEFEMEDQGFRIAIKRRDGTEAHVVMSGMPHAQMMMAHPSMPMSPAPVAADAVAAKEKAADAHLVPVKSPIVGTFYRAPTPDAEPFASIGQSVTKDSVVCIIEAMKVMNEIKAEVSGVIKKILVENATPVQFGQPLFLVDPS
ncbi:MAG TPA: acetyl-CoA carboxylase biotin carboxyl carrier protein [Verrucomicrobia bacterium]|nr:MAG: acetyl-CoA carboxylase, biotin carboxyl carrier protein [Lentisphaerae bacterium GWF2_57_35]HBA85604.1 acetyl-CoA carboxylase biotin carboxyl carrier protein [Verrucomicrobiota bacterium]